MRDHRRTQWLALLVCVSLRLPMAAFGFGAATHIYIAASAFSEAARDPVLHYGAIAPDVVVYSTLGSGWLDPFDDTHYALANLFPYARRKSQRSFAAGWMSHNEAWGADSVAHIGFEGGPGYVVAKAREVLAISGPITGDVATDEELAHLLVEAAVDLWIAERVPELRMALFKSLQTPRDAGAIVYAALRMNGRWVSSGELVRADGIFRLLQFRYALALYTSSVEHPEPMAELGVQFARFIYGLDVSRERSLEMLQIAIRQCESDHAAAVNEAVRRVKAGAGR